jgi:two-component system nitrogen regulation sensor histidine kinase NtrY
MQRISRQFRRLKNDGLLPENDQVHHFEKILDEALTTVEAETRTLKYLVEEFSRFARLPSPTLKIVDFNKIVSDVARGFPKPGMDVQVETKLDSSLPELYLDPELIRSVLVNLLNNACDAAQESSLAGKVSIRTFYQVDSQRALLEVVDNGPGISEDVSDHLFLPYFSTKETGMGLGLTLVKKILDDHDAAIRAENLSPGGCRFIVEFRKIKSVD